jgi:iron only hydrogenase large subunit-like protein
MCLSLSLSLARACMSVRVRARARVPTCGRVRARRSSRNGHILTRSGASLAAPHCAAQAQALEPGAPIKVTLHDCLACSGCVTSAEAVLLESQSGEEFEGKLAAARAAAGAAAGSNGGDPSYGGAATATTSTTTSTATTAAAAGHHHDAAPPLPPVVVVSVSPQSVAALATLHGLAPPDAFARVAAWLTSRGAALVLDASGARRSARLL